MNSYSRDIPTGTFNATSQESQASDLNGILVVMYYIRRGNAIAIICVAYQIHRIRESLVED
jgi:hypothetical protein